jgi:2,4-dienoyl-CoA reductase-like NADH-dependent reductase (Old Yellow Enzyme family)/thioredoxin reductase
MFSAPIGATDITADCCPGERTRAFYELRAQGGAAAVTMSELVVHPETDGSHMLHLNLKTVGSLSGFAWVADSIKRHGAIPSVELSHSGQYGGTYMADKDKKGNLTQYGPSDGVRHDGKKVTALSEAQIEDIVKRYGETAELAKRAGFEMIMVHGGHTWLINQFLSPYFNHRTDRYGGSFENRVRLAREILLSVRMAVGPGFPVEFRMSGSEMFEGGYDLDEGVRIAKAVEEFVDLIHVSAGSYQFGFFNTHPSMFSPHGVNVGLAEEIKKHVQVPVATIGALNDPAKMEEIIASGKADVVEMGRALLADPFLPNKVAVGRDDEIVRCLRCFTCMAERPVTQTRRCAVNPHIGREIEGTVLQPTAWPKKVLVAGAGVAGLKAAITAARRGNKVVLCEKSVAVGGILKCEQGIDFKREMYRLAQTLEAQALAAGVEIRLGTEVTEAYVEDEKTDFLIIAVGSTPIVPNIPGIDRDNVVIVNNYYLEKEKVGKRVVVLGGGLAGCECAVHLAQEGKEVQLIEMQETLAPDVNIRHKPILMQMMEPVMVHTRTTGSRITDDGVVCQDMDGNECLIECDSVICAVGQRANRDVVEGLLDAAPVVREIGDCIKPSNITHAVYQGYHAGMDT